MPGRLQQTVRLPRGASPGFHLAVRRPNQGRSGVVLPHGRGAGRRADAPASALVPHHRMP